MNKWDNRFLDLAEHVATWSKDSSCKVGAIIVSCDNVVLSMGYNGFPSYIHGTKETDADKELKNILTVHAEVNALAHLESNQSDLTLYTSHISCLSCATHIAHTRDDRNNPRIKRVVYRHTGSDSFCDRHKVVAGAAYLHQSGIDVVEISSYKHEYTV